MTLETSGYFANGRRKIFPGHSRNKSIWFKRRDYFAEMWTGWKEWHGLRESALDYNTQELATAGSLPSHRLRKREERIASNQNSECKRRGSRQQLSSRGSWFKTEDRGYKLLVPYHHSANLRLVPCAPSQNQPNTRRLRSQGEAAHRSQLLGGHSRQETREHIVSRGPVWEQFCCLEIGSKTSTWVFS